MPLSGERSVKEQAIRAKELADLAKLEGVDEIELTVHTKLSGDDIAAIHRESVSFRRHAWLYDAPALVLLQVSLLAGAALTFYGTRSAGPDFKLLLFSMATLCIGFGAATLLYRSIGDNRAEELRAEFRNLRARADTLIRKIDDLEHAQAESLPRSVEPGRSSGRL